MTVTRSDLSTTDIGRAHEFLSSVYVDHLPRLARPGPDFLFRSRTAASGDVALNRLSYRGRAETRAEPFGAVTTALLFDGWYSVGAGGRSHRFTAGDALLVPLGAALDVSWSGIDLQTVRFPLAAVTRAAQRLGVEPVDFRFDAPTPVSARMNRHWIATVGYVTRVFAGPDPAVTHPLVYATALDTLAAAAVAVFPNTTMTAGYTAGPGQVPPAVVRRALAYIDAHAAEPITVEDIAAAAGIGVRGLQAAFARHGDLTPPRACAGRGWRAPTATCATATRNRVTRWPRSPRAGDSPHPAGSPPATGRSTAGPRATRCAPDPRAPDHTAAGCAISRSSSHAVVATASCGRAIPYPWARSHP
ncbi:hypothetical protein [Actinoplanes sp. CA-252034]|uniref:hypothetical protein n=1 Tax=Actinoplanes sp. CA-252034 TaxID=3239906 RepID=UPI003D9837DB